MGQSTTIQLTHPTLKKGHFGVFSHSTKENDRFFSKCDFNARTGILPDYVIENDDTISLNLPGNYELDELTRTRNNQGVHKNTYIEKPIDFAIATKMRILNGGRLGDFIG